MLPSSAAKAVTASRGFTNRTNAKPLDLFVCLQPTRETRFCLFAMLKVTAVYREKSCWCCRSDASYKSGRRDGALGHLALQELSQAYWSFQALARHVKKMLVLSANLLGLPIVATFRVSGHQRPPVHHQMHF